MTAQGLCFSRGVHSVPLGRTGTCAVTGGGGTAAGEQGSTGRGGPFVPAGKQFECPLVQLIESGFGGPLFELDVAEPAFDRELVPHDFFLIGKVFFLLPGPGEGRRGAACLSLSGVRPHTGAPQKSHALSKAVVQAYTPAT